ncbi:hypothetical protein Aduo_004037 [Ancylostoma duodenale]
MRLLLVSSILWVTSHAMRKPDLYVWLEQNSYICDLSLFGSSLPHFLSPDEARQFACDCGDPLISRAACARHANEVPTCHEIPDLCMREYGILFTEVGDRLAQPLTTKATTTTTEPPTTTKEFLTTIRVLPPPQRRQPFLRKFQRQPVTTRRPLRREFVFRNRVPLRDTRRPLRKQKTFPLNNRFPNTRRPLRPRERARPLPRLLPSSRFRSPQRFQKQLGTRRQSVNFTASRFNRGGRRPAPTTTPTTTTTTPSRTTTTTTTTASTTTTTPTTTTTTATTTTTTPSTTTTRTTPSTTTTTKATTTSTTPKTTTPARTTTIKTTRKPRKPTTTTTKATITTTIPKPTNTTLRTTTNIVEVIKMSKTEQLIAELTNRLRAMGHKEPEHPLKGLEELFLGKTRPTTTMATTTMAPTTKKTTKKPEMVDEEVRNEAKITSAEINTRGAQTEKELPQVEGTIRQVPAAEEKIQADPEKTTMITVKSNPADVGVKSSENVEGPEMKEIAPFPPQEEKSKEQLIQDDPSQARKPEAEKESRASRSREADVPRIEDSQPKKSKAPWDNQEEAIEFLRKKVEQLEVRLKETFERRAIPAAKEFSNPDDLVASDDEVVNIRRQSRLDSRRRNSNIDFTEENSFLKSLDDIERILTDAMPTREGQKKEKKKEKQVADNIEKEEKEVKEVVEGSGNEKLDPEITVMLTTTDKAPYTSVELLTHEPESSTPMIKECTDTHDLCPTWKTGQLCLTSPMFMFKFCRKTCGMC